MDDVGKAIIMLEPWNIPNTVEDACAALKVQYGGRLSRFQHELIENDLKRHRGPSPVPGFVVKGWFHQTMFTIPLIWPTVDIDAAEYATRYWVEHLGVTMHGAGRLKKVFFGFGHGSVQVAPENEGFEFIVQHARTSLKNGIFPSVDRNVHGVYLEPPF